MRTIHAVWVCLALIEAALIGVWVHTAHEAAAMGHLVITEMSAPALRNR
jgi:hypothetical protein